MVEIGASLVPSSGHLFHRSSCTGALVLLAIVGIAPFIGTSHAFFSASSSGRTVTGPQRLLVIATEFVDAKHSPTRDLDYIRKLVFGTVNDFFTEASYNRTWLVGKVTDRWYTLGKNASFYELRALPQCQPKNWGPLISEAIKLASRHEDLAAYKFFIVVHPAKGSMWDIACGLGDNKITTPSGNSVTLRGVLIDTNHQASVWAHELGHSIGYLPDMYAVTNNRPADPAFVGPWDLMSYTGFQTPQHFSIWSKIKLGWIDSAQVVSVSHGKAVNVEIHAQETKSQYTVAVKSAITSTTYYLVELRENVGYDTELPDHGIVIYFVDETKMKWGQSPLLVQDGNPNTSTLDDATFDLKAAKQPGLLDREHDVSIVITSKSNSSYVIFVGPVKQGEIVLAKSEKMSAAITAVNDADASIQAALLAGRTEGIDKAKSLLSDASNAFEKEDYDAAVALAQQAKEAADSAKYVEAYYEAKDLLLKAMDLRSRTSHLTYPEARSLVQRAESAYALATAAFMDNDYAVATHHAKTAIALFEEALSVEQHYPETLEAQRRQAFYTLICAISGIAIAVAAVYVARKRARRSGPG